MYRRCMGKKLNLKNPQTFNEKLQWLKLYNRNPEYTKMVDKYEVKKYVADKIGEEYIIPTLGVWNKFEEIDFDTLPQQFVLKTTHDSGGVVICRDKSSFDYEAAKKKLNTSLKNNFYYMGREWPYKNVKPRIIAEKYMEDSATKELRDYKLFAFDGVVKALFIASDRQNPNEDTKFDFFDSNLKHLDFTNGHPNATVTPAMPESFEEMKKLAEKLSEKIPHLRCDFYEINGKVYFGELAFFHWSGFTPFNPDEWDKTFGDWLKLPEKSGGGYACIGKDFILWLHEENAEESKIENIPDYKFMCFNGKVECLFVCSERNSADGLKVTFFDRDWNLLPFTRHYPKSEKEIQRPVNLEQMIEIAEKLSTNLPFVRIDLYYVDGRIYFGEYTFFPGNGIEEFNPDEWDLRLGKMLELKK